LGNVQYGGEDSGSAYITTETQIKYLARVIGQFIYITGLWPHVHDLFVCVNLHVRGLFLTVLVCVFVILQLLGVDGTVLKEALTHKKIIAKGEEVCS